MRPRLSLSKRAYRTRVRLADGIVLFRVNMFGNQSFYYAEMVVHCMEIQRLDCLTIVWNS